MLCFHAESVAFSAGRDCCSFLGTEQVPQWQTKQMTSHRLAFAPGESPRCLDRGVILSFGALTLKLEQRQTPAFQSCLWPFGVAVRFSGRLTVLGLGSKSPCTEFRPCTFCQVGYVVSPVARRTPRFLCPLGMWQEPAIAVYFFQGMAFQRISLSPKLHPGGGLFKSKAT